MAAITVFGVTGRMGQSLVLALRDFKSADGAAPLELVGATASAHSSRLDLDAATDGAPTGVRVTSDPTAALSGAAVALDFSVPLCVADNARACAAAGAALLVGATGFDAAARAALTQAAAVIAVLIAPNTSVGVSLVAHLTRLAARALPKADVEISEAHHRMKRDAPSGTALALGEAVAAPRRRHRFRRYARWGHRRRAHGAVCGRRRTRRDHASGHRPQPICARRTHSRCMARRPAARFVLHG